MCPRHPSRNSRLLRFNIQSEEIKKQTRAARFGTGNTDLDRIKKRSERFGVQDGDATKKPNGRREKSEKRAESVDDVKPITEKMAKRAERFTVHA